VVPRASWPGPARDLRHLASSPSPRASRLRPPARGPAPGPAVRRLAPAPWPPLLRCTQLPWKGLMQKLKFLDQDSVAFGAILGRRRPEGRVRVRPPPVVPKTRIRAWSAASDPAPATSPNPSSNPSPAADARDLAPRSGRCTPASTTWPPALLVMSPRPSPMATSLIF